MEEFGQVFTLSLTLWVMAIGLGFIIRGQRGGVIVFLWPIRMTVRFLRWAIGGILIFLGNFIRGR